MRQRVGRDDGKKDHEDVRLGIGDIAITTGRADRPTCLGDTGRSTGEAPEEEATTRGVPDHQRSHDKPGPCRARESKPPPIKAKHDQSRDDRKDDKTDTEDERARERLTVTRQPGRPVVPIESERAVADAYREEVQRDREKTAAHAKPNSLFGLGLAA